MDDHDYCPGEGKIREQWNQIYGDGIYVLMTSRLDSKVKGQDENFLQMLIKVAQERPQVKFIFLMWGNSVKEFQEQMDNCQQKQQFICLEPVGKKRLIDYYRSCDIVLDQFVYGYYGATALEAAAIGKPVLIKLRREQYDPLYLGDVAPMINAHNLEDIYQSLLKLIDDLELRHNQGQAVRQWLVRNHGEQKTVPLMLALLRLTADQIALPPDLKNPLYDSLSQEELDYHKSCRV
jgi:glycosyltransferase involved in cell wall biosynthesis